MIAADAAASRAATGRAADPAAGGPPDAELREAVKRYPDGTVAVDGVSFAVRPGELFSILGPSGCGKSTTLRMIAGLERVTAGEIYIRGEPMGDRPAHRRPTNLVFQRLALFPHLSVAQNIGFGPKLRRVPARRVRETVDRMLALVELTGYGGRYPDQLSGGQQQRVAVARALANQPAVLLLDEPLGALDLRLRVQLQQAFKEIQHSSGTTFVYVTHDQTEAMAMSDRIAVMNRGRIEQIDTPDRLYHQPRTTFVATFLGETNLFRGRRDGRMLHADGVSLAVPGPGSAAAVRPERLRLAGTLDPPPANRYPAVLTDATFQGAFTRYAARLDSGRTLLVDVANDEPAARPGLGERVEVGFADTAVVMLRDDTGAGATGPPAGEAGPDTDDRRLP